MRRPERIRCAITTATIAAVVLGFVAQAGARYHAAVAVPATGLPQLRGMGFVAVFAPVATLVILAGLRLAFRSLRVDEEAEVEGLDVSEHSESAYGVAGGSVVAPEAGAHVMPHPRPAQTPDQLPCARRARHPQDFPGSGRYSTQEARGGPWGRG